jgi:hypothetical protein
MMTVTREEIEDLLTAAGAVCGMIEVTERARAAYRRALGIVISAGALNERRAAIALKRAGIDIK